MAGKQRKPKVKQTREDREQVQIRRDAGLGFTLVDDGKGGKKQATGTAESKRKLGRAPGGMIRVRGGDQIAQLLKHGTITPLQAEGGDAYRKDCEIAESHGLGSVELGVKVDGGCGAGTDIPARVMDATRRLQKAGRELGEDKVRLVFGVTMHDLNISQVSRKTGVHRDIVRAMLLQALDDLAICYGFMHPRQRTNYFTKIEVPDS